MCIDEYFANTFNHSSQIPNIINSKLLQTDFSSTPLHLTAWTHSNINVLFGMDLQTVVPWASFFFTQFSKQCDIYLDPTLYKIPFRCICQLKRFFGCLDRQDFANSYVRWNLCTNNTVLLLLSFVFAFSSVLNMRWRKLALPRKIYLFVS